MFWRAWTKNQRGFSMKDAMVTFRTSTRRIEEMDIAAAALGLSRSAWIDHVIEAASRRSVDPKWSCRTVLVSGRSIYTSGFIEPRSTTGLRTEIVAPLLFWDALDRAEEP